MDKATLILRSTFQGSLFLNIGKLDIRNKEGFSFNTLMYGKKEYYVLIILAKTISIEEAIGLSHCIYHKTVFQSLKKRFH